MQALSLTLPFFDLSSSSDFLSLVSSPGLLFFSLSHQNAMLFSKTIIHRPICLSSNSTSAKLPGLVPYLHPFSSKRANFARVPFAQMAAVFISRPWLGVSTQRSTCTLRNLRVLGSLQL